jgi:hypothetical protein
MRRRGLAQLILFGSLACTRATAPDAALSHVAGQLRVGPTQPVCQPDVPCDAPLEAGFTIRQGGHVRARLHSDASGRFTVTLPTGNYDVVLDPDTPGTALLPQTQPLAVGPDSVTTVVLVFDTGIR